MELQTLDIIILLPLIWGAYKGFKKGIIIEIASLLALILGVYGALNFSKYAAEIINSNFEVDPYWIGILSFSTTFIAIIFAVHLVAKLVDKAMKMAALGIFVKISGLIFGIIKYAFILSILLFIMEGFDEKFNFLDADWNDNSIVYPLISKLNIPLREFLEDLNLKSVEEVIKTV